MPGEQISKMYDIALATLVGDNHVKLLEYLESLIGEDADVRDVRYRAIGVSGDGSIRLEVTATETT